jgi:hypothetical protein
MIGRKVGLLTVLKPSPDEKGKFLCRCECDNKIVSVWGSALSQGRTTSCGCYGSKFHRLQLTGQRFGRLTVVGFAYIKKGASYWDCICKCGNSKVALGSLLTSNQVKSCGCLAKDVNRDKASRMKRETLIEAGGKTLNITEWSKHLKLPYYTIRYRVRKGLNIITGEELE